jgi:hypothetical protein
MQIRVFLAALLGLAILAPAVSSATARDTRFPLLLAQASQTDEEKAKEEEEKRQKSRRPDRDDAKDKGAAKSGADQGTTEKSKDAAAPAKGGEPKQQTKDEPRPQRDQDRARGGDKAKQDAAQKALDETKSKAAAPNRVRPANSNPSASAPTTSRFDPSAYPLSTSSRRSACRAYCGNAYDQNHALA